MKAWPGSTWLQWESAESGAITPRVDGVQASERVSRSACGAPAVLHLTVYREGTDTACAAFPPSHIWCGWLVDLAAGSAGEVLSSVWACASSKSPCAHEDVTIFEIALLY